MQYAPIRLGAVELSLDEKSQDYTRFSDDRLRPMASQHAVWSYSFPAKGAEGAPSRGARRAPKGPEGPLAPKAPMGPKGLWARPGYRACCCLLMPLLESWIKSSRR